MKFDGKIVQFNIFEAMRYLSDLHSFFALDGIRTLVQEFLELSGNDSFEVAICKNLRKKDFKEQVSLIELDDVVKESMVIQMGQPYYARTCIMFFFP